MSQEEDLASFGHNKLQKLESNTQSIVMVSTRSGRSKQEEQSTLKVEAGKLDPKASTSEGNGSNGGGVEKRKKADEQRGAEDIGDKDDGPPSAKAVKTEEHQEPSAGDEKGSKEVPEEEEPAKPEERKQDSKPAEPAGKVEEKVGGEDVGSVGHNQNDVKWNALERGHIYFFYRPKVQPASNASNNEPAAQSIDDAQNFHMLLLPRASDSETAPAKPADEQPNDVENKAEQSGERARQGGIGARMIRLGKKRMPEPNAAISQGDQPGGIGGDSSETIWSVVSDVSPDFASLKDQMAARQYTTKTAGERIVQAARPVGRGWYIIAVSETDPPSSREVRLSYVLSHPHDEAEFGDVQKEFGLNKESSVRLQMRNPTLQSTGPGAPPAGLDPSSRVQMDKSELEQTFGGTAEGDGTRYARPENLELLDRAGVELLMIKKKEQEVEGDLGMGETHQKALEKLAKEDHDKLSHKDVLAEIRLSSSENPPDAMDGEWV